MNFHKGLQIVSLKFNTFWPEILSQDKSRLGLDTVPFFSFNEKSTS